MNKTANYQENTSKDTGHQMDINGSNVLKGTLTVLAFLTMVVFWGTFAYSMVTENLKLAMAFGQIIAVMVGVAVPILIVQKLLEHINKK